MPCPPLFQNDLEHVLSHTENLWEEARGQSFFITGGTGFFGVWLLETFCHANDKLGLGMRAVVLTRNPESFAAKCPHLAKRKDLEFLKGDVKDFKFPDGKFPFVIHAATEASAKLNEEAPDEMLGTIVEGTRRVLAFAEKCGARKLLLTSSGAVYGAQPPDMTHVPEEYAGAPNPLLPGSAYGEGKRVSEHLCAVHSKRFGYEAKIARCFAFVGPHLPLDAHFAIGNFIRDALAGKPVQIGGDGSPFRSYLYAADLAAWLWTILFKAPALRAFNVGSDVALSIRQVAEIVAAQEKHGGQVKVAREPEPGKPASRYVPSVQRAKVELGLAALVPLDEAVRRTIAWHELKIL